MKHSNLKKLLSTVLVVFVATFLVLCIVKFHELQRQQDVQQKLLQQHLLREQQQQRQSVEAGSRRKRAAAVEEEEEEGNDQSIQSVLERKDVVYIVSDTKKTIRADKYKGM